MGRKFSNGTLLAIATVMAGVGVVRGAQALGLNVLFRFLGFL